MEAVLASVVGSVVKVPFEWLFEAAKKAHKLAKTFPIHHSNLISTLDSLVPLIAQINHTGTNLVSKNFTKTMEDGKKLVERCEGKLNYFEKAKYAQEIVELDKSLQRLLLLLAVQLGVNSAVVLNRIDANLVPQNQIRYLITTRYAIRMKLLTDNTPSMLVLTALPGCGKTFLAKMLCHDQRVKGINAKFKDNIFFTMVSENPNIDVQEFCQHAGFRSPALENEEIAARQNPFLLILDDVPSTSESLLHEFNQINISDSKILVTSRCHFPKFGSPHEVQPLSNDDAETLFCRSAFRNTSLSKGDFQEELNKIISHCKKFPLAIKTIGGSLCNQPIEKWILKRTELSEGSILESEESLRVVLQSCLDDLNKRMATVKNCFKMATVKDCFKDLGLFPKNQRIPVAALLDMWAEFYEGSNDNMSMVNLYELTICNLASIVITRNKGIDGYYGEHFAIQHDMLKLLSILESSEDPMGNRLIIDIRESSSTKWHDMDLPKGEVLVLNFQAKNYALPKFMKKMSKLKVLIVTNDGFSPAELSNIELLCSLSNLKRLRFERILIPLISKMSIQSKSLKKISLFMCNVREAFGNSSIQIFEIFPYLEELHIDYCSDLEKLPAKLCDLKRLKVLSITNCHKLSVLPEDIGKLENLEVLRLRSCTDLEELPGSIEKLSKLYFLDIYDCSSIKELPECIAKMNGLRKINMAQCSRLNMSKVTCDEDKRDFWESVFSNPDKITVANEEFNLNWLHGPQN
ncbi:unnamed protein product [Malus baccata var. baccata]